jgi:hypothetical protein
MEVLMTNIIWKDASDVSWSINDYSGHPMVSRFKSSIDSDTELSAVTASGRVSAQLARLISLVLCGQLETVTVDGNGFVTFKVGTSDLTIEVMPDDVLFWSGNDLVSVSQFWSLLREYHASKFLQPPAEWDAFIGYQDMTGVRHAGG